MVGGCEVYIKRLYSQRGLRDPLREEYKKDVFISSNSVFFPPSVTKCGCLLSRFV